MRPRSVWIATLISVFVAGCGPGEVVVTAEIEMPDPEGNGTTTRPLSGLEIQLLPYDRDQLFDSLEAAYSEPEPEIPEELAQAREEVAEAQQEWRQWETRWNTLRDSLQTISQAMQGLNRGEAQYVALFREFQDLEGEVGSAENRMEDAFERFDSLQRGIIEESERIRLAREEWADAAFADALVAIEARIEAAGREPVIDTTDANGTVRMRAPPGQWWVHTRHELPYAELYWNVPIELTREEAFELLLNRENAEERSNL